MFFGVAGIVFAQRLVLDFGEGEKAGEGSSGGEAHGPGHVLEEFGLVHGEDEFLDEGQAAVVEDLPPVFQHHGDEFHFVGADGLATTADQAFGDQLLVQGVGREFFVHHPFDDVDFAAGGVGFDFICVVDRAGEEAIAAGGADFRNVVYVECFFVHCVCFFVCTAGPLAAGKCLDHREDLIGDHIPGEVVFDVVVAFDSHVATEFAVVVDGLALTHEVPFVQILEAACGDVDMLHQDVRLLVHQHRGVLRKGLEGGDGEGFQRRWLDRADRAFEGRELFLFGDVAEVAEAVDFRDVHEFFAHQHKVQEPLFSEFAVGVEGDLQAFAPFDTAGVHYIGEKFQIIFAKEAFVDAGADIQTGADQFGDVGGGEEAFDHRHFGAGEKEQGVWAGEDRLHEVHVDGEFVMGCGKEDAGFMDDFQSFDGGVIEVGEEEEDVEVVLLVGHGVDEAGAIRSLLDDPVFFVPVLGRGGKKFLRMRVEAFDVPFALDIEALDGHPFEDGLPFRVMGLPGDVVFGGGGEYRYITAVDVEAFGHVAGQSFGSAHHIFSVPLDDDGCFDHNSFNSRWNSSGLEDSL